MTARIIKENPLFGIGFNHFRIRFNEYCNEKEKGNVPYEYMIPDNMYLTFLAETGIVGTAGFLIFIFLLFKQAIKAFKRLGDGSQRQFLLVVITALVGLLVNMAAYELFYWYNPYMLFCLACGLIASVIKDERLINRD
jgi:O-antigen ligase